MIAMTDISSDSDFSIANLPFGRARRLGRDFVASRIGDWVIDLSSLASDGILSAPDGLKRGIIIPSILEYRELRRELIDLIHHHIEKLSNHCYPIGHVELLLPMRPPAYVDFYSGIHHATNVGQMFRPDAAPLLPNYRHVPIAYNGRASTVNCDPFVRRPNGQRKPSGDEPPDFGLTRELDFELEMGFYLGLEAESSCITIENAIDAIFGFVMVNDWSARDVQRWEYQPLGPFLAKSFSTSISPWIVFIDALKPFACEGMAQEPTPLPYLQVVRPFRLNLELGIALQAPRSPLAQTISRTNSKELYWGFDQQLAHQASNGTRLEASDLYASGTISSQEPHEDGMGAFGSLLELTWRGQKPLKLHETGEQRTFLEDGDKVIFTGHQVGDGGRVGFGDLSGTVQVG